MRSVHSVRNIEESTKAEDHDDDAAAG